MQTLTVVALLALVAVLTAGCSTDPHASEASHVLELSKSNPLSSAIHLDGKTLVRSSDATQLQAGIDTATDLPKKQEVVSSYLTQREEIDCVIDSLESSLLEGVAVSCKGKTLVNLKGEYGLLGVEELSESLKDLDSDQSKRLYVTDHLRSLDAVNKISRILDSIDQVQRSRNIPILGSLVRIIHKFPIVYEGKELVPYSRIDSLIEKLDNIKPESERRSIAKMEFDE